MNYEIHIQDMEKLDDPLIVHFSSRDSVSLQYEGGQDMDKPVDGSSVDYDLETLDGRDFKYGQYFTSNEKRYQVTWVIGPTQEIFWRGFILPETFSEPYLNPTFYTKFTATCGLGLLKGKTLPDDFYTEEKTVIQVISACIQLTEVNFQIWLSPAIHNAVQENWNGIYQDMLHYQDEDKKESAYKILEDLMISMVCKIYQCDGVWYVEGINRRNLPKNKYFKYDYRGNFLGSYIIEKQIKPLKWFINGSGSVSMVPALGTLTLSHESPEVKVNTAVYKDDNIDWVVGAGLDGAFHPREWILHGDWTLQGSNMVVLPLMRPQGYYLDLHFHQNNTLRTQNFISIRKRPYLRKGTRTQLRMKMKLKNGTAEIEAATHQENYDRENYVDLLVYRISLNDTVLYSTLPGNTVDPQKVNLDAQGRGELQLDFVAGQNGYLNIEIWEPHSTLYGIGGPRMNFELIEVRDLLQRENDVITLTIDENSSITKDIELPISDDISAESLCFTLEPIRDLSEDASEGRLFKVPILYSITQGGNFYSVVSVKGAVLMEQYPDRVTWNSFLFGVNDFEVVYNLNGTSEMAIKTSRLYADGNFYVDVRPLAEPTTDRVDWLKWTDSIYAGEQKPYLQVVSEIYRRLYQTPRLKLKGSVDAPLKYNDLLEFEYNGEKRLFALSNLEWRPTVSGGGITTFTAYEAFYDGVGAGSVPPYVDAGSDHVLEASANSVQVFDAVVNDPDSASVQLTWTKLSGDPGDSISNTEALLPLISGLTGDAYEYQLKAEDPEGNISFDTMQIRRPQTHELKVFNFFNSDRAGEVRSKYRVIPDPDIPVGSTLFLDFVIQTDLEIERGKAFVFATGIIKNGTYIYAGDRGFGNYEGVQNFTDTGSYQITDDTEIIIEHHALISRDFRGTVRMSLSYTNMEFLEETNARILTPYPEITKEYTT